MKESPLTLSLKLAADVLTISSLLTLIITTSPTPSAPSAELISSALDSFRSHCPNLLRCSLILVFDTYDCIVSTARLKEGCVTAEQTVDYSLYKRNVKKLILA
jgi:hypothetical protein